jgi:hypothetical protein
VVCVTVEEPITVKEKLEGDDFLLCGMEMEWEYFVFVDFVDQNLTVLESNCNCFVTET